jgi:hypothetical protein
MGEVAKKNNIFLRVKLAYAPKGAVVLSNLWRA